MSRVPSQGGEQRSSPPNKLAQLAWERAQVGDGVEPMNDTLVGTVVVITGELLNEVRLRR